MFICSHGSRITFRDSKRIFNGKRLFWNKFGKNMEIFQSFMRSLPAYFNSKTCLYFCLPVLYKQDRQYIYILEWSSNFANISRALKVMIVMVKENYIFTWILKVKWKFTRPVPWTHETEYLVLY